VAVAMLPDAPESYYTPERVTYWLLRWDELLSLAETPKTSRHLRSPGCRPGASCSYGALTGIRDIRGGRSDQLAYADIVSDIERAHASLGFGSLRWRVVDCRMRRLGTPHPADTRLGPGEGSVALRDIARSLRMRYETVKDAYDGATRSMAEHLGWSEP
jgi:hypothetical protein